jgi:hypothetical protein
LLSQGWVDALRAKHPQEPIYTFWDYFRNHWPRNSGLRIDHLLLNSELAPRLLDANVDRWVRGQQGASDHAPTWVELAQDSGARRVHGARQPQTRRHDRASTAERVAPVRESAHTAVFGPRGRDAATGVGENIER